MLLNLAHRTKQPVVTVTASQMEGEALFESDVSIAQQWLKLRNLIVAPITEEVQPSLLRDENRQQTLNAQFFRTPSTRPPCEEPAVL